MTEQENGIKEVSLPHDEDTLRIFTDIKNIALGHARLLYGSEPGKFYDIITGRKDNNLYFAFLVCSQDRNTKFLRKEMHSSALAATRALVDGLMSDTAKLEAKYNVGDQISGQQGFRDPNGIVELSNLNAVKDEGPLDNTRTLSRQYHNTPTGPSGKFTSNKRVRTGHEGIVGRSQPTTTDEGLDYGD